MKLCQNSNCNKEITRDTALYCPYCGHYQAITGWHFHQQPYFLNIGQNLGNDISFSRPLALKLNKKVDDCLADGNIFIIVADNTLTAYDLELTLNSGNAEQKWTAFISESARAIILRPYVLVFEKDQIRIFHLVTGSEKKLLSYADADEILPFKDSEMIIPLELNGSDCRQSVILCSVDNALLIYLFDRFNSLRKHVVVPVAFKSPILSMHRDSQEEEIIHLFSRQGETTRLNLKECINGKNAPDCMDRVHSIYPEMNIPKPGAELEFAFFKRDVYFTLVRNLDGKTIFYKTDSRESIAECKETVNKKSPSIGLNSPHLLFESDEYSFLLQGYNFAIHGKIQKSINVPTCLGLDPVDFELCPDKLIFFSKKYWAICPCSSAVTPYRLVNCYFGEEDEIKVDPIINIPIQCKEKHKAQLPLLLVDNKILTYIENIVIIIN